MTARFPLLHGLGGSLGELLSPRHVAFFAAAPLLTWLLIATGVDGAARTVQAEWNPLHDWLPRFFGLFLPALGPVLLALVLLRRGSTGSGCALGQAIIVTALVTTALKLATGRPQPESLATSPWDFRFLAFSTNEGRFMWPSGHTSEAVSAATALASFHGWRRDITLAVLAGALCVALVMLLGCYHWLSDVVAGALIAWPLGTTIGRRFRVSFAA